MGGASAARWRTGGAPGFNSGGRRRDSRRHRRAAPSEHYKKLTEAYGTPFYSRMDAPASPEEKNRLKKLSARDIKEETLAGERITRMLTEAPGNGAAIGGLKVVTENGWFAARPSGTEDIYKIYAESFNGQEHLKKINEEAQAIVKKAIA